MRKVPDLPQYPQDRSRKQHFGVPTGLVSIGMGCFKGRAAVSLEPDSAACAAASAQSRAWTAVLP
jgi:hypothetical protein